MATQHICGYQSVIWSDQAPLTPASAEPPSSAPPEHVLQGSVVGYRGWRIEGWQLASTVLGALWTPGVNEAKCVGWNVGAPPHPAPDAGCECGLYALARFADGPQWWLRADVVGAVEAWADEDPDGRDRFFVHSTGFRAQYAKVILLAVSDEYPRAKNAAIRALAAEHGADVCDREHLEAAAMEHGQLVPDELLEWAKEDELLPSAPRYASGGYVRGPGLSSYAAYAPPKGWLHAAIWALAAEHGAEET